VIRLATIGTSVITERFIDASRLVDGVRVDVVHSRDLARARAFADRVGVTRAVDDLDALLRSGDIDAVYVGSPNGAHAGHARAAIAAGIHVFLEKPATPDADDFAALVAEADAAGVVVFEGMRNVYDPGMAVVAEILAEIGAVRRASFALCQRSARYDLVLAGETPNIFDPALAGGALMDLGVYPLSALIHLFGPPASVSAVTVPIATGADGAGTALLAYPGFVADAGYSKITFSDRPSEIQGELGTITIDQITQPRLVSLALLDGSTSERRVDGHENNMVYELERFAALVRGEVDATPDQERTLAVLRAVEEIRGVEAIRGATSAA
jgi:predicted dehydrogenase